MCINTFMLLGNSVLCVLSISKDVKEIYIEKNIRLAIETFITQILITWILFIF